ncbi:hypothetical protein ACFL1Y_00495 [Patescibacteria group bacterium]
MISLEKGKQLLGDEAKKYTDEELIKIRDDFYQFAELAFEQWAKDKKLKNNTF